MNIFTLHTRAILTHSEIVVSFFVNVGLSMCQLLNTSFRLTQWEHINLIFENTKLFLNVIQIQLYVVIKWKKNDNQVT